MYDRVLGGMALPPAIAEGEELTLDKFEGGLQSAVAGRAEARIKIAA